MHAASVVRMLGVTMAAAWHTTKRGETGLYDGIIFYKTMLHMQNSSRGELTSSS